MRQKLPVIEAQFREAKRLALLRKSIWDLTLEDFKEFSKISTCVYCGNEIRWGEIRPRKDRKCGRVSDNLNLDRIDNSKGYTKNNVLVCCKRCNQVRNSHFTVEEFEQIAVVIKRIDQQRKQPKESLEESKDLWCPSRFTEIILNWLRRLIKTRQNEKQTLSHNLQRT
jgi:hypothetical protein